MVDFSSKLTAFFEDPFWVGVYERECGGTCEACRIVFGAEPKDRELYDFLLKNWHRLKFSPSVAAEYSEGGHVNPKRMQRDIEKQLHRTGAGTKAQQALARQREQKEQEKQRRFELRQQRQKEKNRGH